MQLTTLRELARYWGTDYNWRKCEAKLNALPQFKTEIDGVDIHFIHVKSDHDDALPLIITHGWPGSIIEMLEVIGPLTEPTAHGGQAEDAFDVVIPSMPGYGFSGEPKEVGWDAGRTAQAWAELMSRLGYTRYVAQGGDQGAGVTDAMGRQAPEGLLGLHFNFLDAAPRELLMAALNIRLAFSMEDREELSKVGAVFMRGYIAEMGEHPQTIGYPLLDSPLGLAAWMLDHDADSYEKISRAFLDGQPSGNLTREHVLDNITLYWLTNTAASALGLLLFCLLDIFAEDVLWPFRVYQDYTGECSLGSNQFRKGPTVPDVHVYINRPAENEGTTLEDLEEILRNLDYVSDLDVNPPGNVVAVSFEGGKAEREEIKRAVEEAGYEVSRLSVRSDFTEERNLWDI